MRELIIRFFRNVIRSCFRNQVKPFDPEELFQEAMKREAVQ